MERFVCPFPHPAVVGTDLFLMDPNQWESLYLFPPTNLILKVLNHLSRFQGEVLLIAPYSRGLSPAEITAAVFWSSSNVFVKHYLDPGVSASLPCIALGKS